MKYVTSNAVNAFGFGTAGIPVEIQKIGEKCHFNNAWETSYVESLTFMENLWFAGHGTGERCVMVGDSLVLTANYCMTK